MLFTLKSNVGFIKFFKPTHTVMCTVTRHFVRCTLLVLDEPSFALRAALILCAFIDSTRCWF